MTWLEVRTCVFTEQNVHNVRHCLYWRDYKFEFPLDLRIRDRNCRGSSKLCVVETDLGLREILGAF